MLDQQASTVRVRFGLFEADFTSGELWRSGHRVRLQELPFRLLAVLLERPGEVVSREDLQLKLWGKPGAGDYDHSIAIAVAKVREALGDAADNPRFIQTLAKRGYRFIAPVSEISEEVPSATAGRAESPLQASVNASVATDEAEASGRPETPEDVRSGLLTVQAASTTTPGLGETLPSKPRAWSIVRSHKRSRIAIGCITLAGVILSLGYLAGKAGRVKEIYGVRQLTSDGHILPAPPTMETFPVSVTDGAHLFSTAIAEGHGQIVQVGIVDGLVTPLELPAEIAGPALDDISPDGSRLLVRSHLSNESEQPLWIVPIRGGSGQRVANILAHDATWMPNGQDILYATGD